MRLAPKTATGNHVIWRGREYDLTHRVHVNELARNLGIRDEIATLYEDGALQADITAAFWRTLLIGAYAAGGTR